MNQLDLAIHSTVHDDPNLSTQEISDQMGVSRQILLNKSCPTTENAYFSPPQLAQLQRITGNYSINKALAAMEKTSQPSGKDIEHLLLQTTGELGHLINEIADAKADNEFTQRERADCIKLYNKLMETANEVGQSLYGNSEAKQA